MAFTSNLMLKKKAQKDAPFGYTYIKQDRSIRLIKILPYLCLLHLITQLPSEFG